MEISTSVLSPNLFGMSKMSSKILVLQVPRFYILFLNRLFLRPAIFLFVCIVLDFPHWDGREGSVTDILTALPEDLNLVPSTHMTARDPL